MYPIIRPSRISLLSLLYFFQNDNDYCGYLCLKAFLDQCESMQLKETVTMNISKTIVEA